MIKRFIITTLIVGNLLAVAWAKRTVDTVWGPVQVKSKVIERLLESKAMKRLKHIDQSGPLTYFGMTPPFSRYDHCVGVWALLQKAGVPEKEQVAGLLHDASHTAFSHVADHLFDEPDGHKSYQDKIHVSFLRKIGVEGTIKDAGYTIEEMDPDLPAYKALECELPCMCADRIQYNLHTAVTWGLLEESDVKEIVENLTFMDGKWYFTSPTLARKFAEVSLTLTKTQWGSDWNQAFYRYFTKILKRAMDLKLVSSDQIHYGTDRQVLDILRGSNDPQIQKWLKACEHIFQNFTHVEDGEGAIHLTPKFRGIDPLVKTNAGFQSLTAIDSDYAEKFEGVKQWCKQGMTLQFKD